jgi:hypothetical protein
MVDHTTARDIAGNTMLNAKRLQSLSQLPAPLLTAYLRTSSGQASLHGPVPGYLTWLKKEAKSLAPNAVSAEHKLFQEQVGRIEAFLRERKAHERGLVLFAGPGAWELISLHVEVENELHWGRPAMTQLLWLLSEHQPYGIVVVDRAGARFFRYWLREMTELEEKKIQIDISQWKKSELGHFMQAGIKKTRGSQRDVFEHRMDARYARSCGEIAEQAKEWCKKEGFAAIFLVGSDRLIQPIEAAFPQKFRQCAVLIKEDLARIASPEMQQRLELRIADWESQQEAELVTALLGSDRGAVVGVDETLAQLQKGKVRTVLLVRDFDEVLAQCVRCGGTHRSADPLCPACGSQRRVVRLRDVLPEIARSYKAEVAVVSGKAANKLREAGGMGAWLRQAKRAGLKKVL